MCSAKGFGLLVERNVTKQIEGMVSPSAKSHASDNLTHQASENSAILENLPFGVMSFNVNPSGEVIVLSANRPARELFSIKTNNTLPVPLTTLWDSEDNKAFLIGLRETALKQRDMSLEWTKRNAQIEHHLASHIQMVTTKGETAPYIICTIEDQTAEKLSKQNIMHHAFHDALTGQPNRVLFRNKLEEAVIDSERGGEQAGCAVLIINIDRFQQINESFGHSAGDRFLISMSSTLRRCIGSTDVLARLSGDEFAVLMPGMQRVKAVEEVSERIHDAMRQPYDLDGNEVFTSRFNWRCNHNFK